MAEKYGKKVRELMVKEMADIFSEKKGFLFSSMENVKAAEMDGLRKKVRQSGSRYLVIKNKLAARALKDAGIDGLTSVVEENRVIGVGIIENDPVGMAKLLAEFAKKKKGFKLSKGYLEGRVLEADRVTELSEMPSREQLLAMVVGTMNAPISGFVGTLSSILRSVMYALNAIKEKKESDQ